MEQNKIISTSALAGYPFVDEKYVDELFKKEMEKDNRKIIVLDDDPTGVQTVHDISVYTDWSEESVKKGFEEDRKLFYILTNSRGLTRENTIRIHKEIACNIIKTAKEKNSPYLIISRSDSTLRGHYPLETEVLRKVIEERENVKIDGEILCPFFKEGGRYTIQDIHYVQYEEKLIPAAQTEFAKDATFSYHSSDLKEYIEERTEGKYKARDVISISLEELRKMELDNIQEKLMRAEDFAKIVVNAADNIDIKIFCIALYRAMRKGKKYLFRTAAAFVKEIGGISARPLLTRREVIKKKNTAGGLIIVGSHTEKTTQQLKKLLEMEDMVPVPFNSDLVLQEQVFEEETARVRKKMEEIILSGKTAVVYTRRKLLSVKNDSKEMALLRSVKISDAVQSLVGGLSIEPSFIIAKGGITSSDIGTKALKVKCAEVLGQICPGIPVWRIKKESRFPDMPYVIFPGNVGDEGTLREAAEVLTGKR